jgi:hypothetical protein
VENPAVNILKEGTSEADRQESSALESSVLFGKRHEDKVTIA